MKQLRVVASLVAGLGMGAAVLFAQSSGEQKWSAEMIQRREAAVSALRLEMDFKTLRGDTVQEMVTALDAMTPEQAGPLIEHIEKMAEAGSPGHRELVAWWDTYKTDFDAEAVVRKQVSRVRSDMRSMATAIESYYVDWNTYPPHTTDVAKSIHASLAIAEPAGAGYDLPALPIQSPLSTPIAYITSHFNDPMARQVGHTFQYYAPETPLPHDPKRKTRQGWIIWSPGPDGDYDLDYRIYDPAVAQPSSELLARYTFDPTNGTISDGDIWRVKQ